MAKSTRSKVKRAYRAKKRDVGVYAAHDAARLQRLSTKLASIKESQAASVEKDELNPETGDEMQTDEREGDSMHLDGELAAGPGVPSSTKISTHGERGSRREEWRLSKGMSRHPQRKGMNKQGGLAAKRRSGRPSRRR